MSRARKEAAPVEKGPLPIDPAYLSAHANPVLASLDQWSAQERVPPVLLLTGPRGSGKREIAYYLAQTLQCERAGFTKPSEEGGLFGASEGGGLFGDSPVAPAAATPARACGECPSCLRALDGNSLDFREIRLEEDKKTYGVDQFREVKETMGFSGYGGGFRIFLVAEAERMTNQAANSLLKLLEEPPPGWIFLLTASDASLLPTTVVSRCQMLRLRPLPEKELSGLLAAREVPSDRVGVAVALAEGSLSRALELSEDEAWEARATLLRFLSQPQSVFFPLVDYASGDVARFRLLLDQFEHLLSDLVRRARMPDAKLRNVDAKKSIEDHFAKCVKRKGSVDAALEFWIGRSERLFKLRREMTTPLSQKILVQDFLAPWMDAV
jgi:hypothetical protein